jgi:hypothetical protein
MFRCVAVALCFIVLSSSAAFAQVIYQPVTYQYDGGRYGEKYYYGGTNPLVHQYAQTYYYCSPMQFGYATNLHRFDSGNSFGQPSPLYYRSAVYTDCIGGGLTDVSWFGWTAADARNEAYANSPTYFRKADLLASAVPQPDGTFVVPFTAPTLYAAPQYGYGTTTAPATLPSAAKKGQIIIIPKRLLDKKVKDLDAKPLKVATAK